MEARWSVQPVAVLFGLANLVVLAHFFGGNLALPTGVSWESVSLRRGARSVLAAVLSGSLFRRPSSDGSIGYPPSDATSSSRNSPTFTPA